MSRGPLVMVAAVSAIFLAIVVLVGGAVALKLGPFARPPGTPTPFRSPASSLVAEVPTEPTDSTGGPTTQQPADTSAPATPTNRPTARPSFANAIDELMSHIPERFRDSCEGEQVEAPVLASTNCGVNDGEVAITYTLYATNDDMYASYNRFFDEAQIDADSGRCYEADGDTITATPGKWPAEHAFSVGGEPVGRYLCTTQLDAPAIAWTDDRYAIAGIVRTAAGGADRLVRLWLNEAGPI
jgi:hypothetical protein